MKRFVGWTGLLLLLSVIPVTAGSLSAALDAATFYHNGTALASDGNCIRAADQYSRAACRLCVCTDENQLQRTRQVHAMGPERAALTVCGSVTCVGCGWKVGGQWNYLWQRNGTAPPASCEPSTVGHDLDAPGELFLDPDCAHSAMRGRE